MVKRKSFIAILGMTFLLAFSIAIAGIGNAMAAKAEGVEESSVTLKNVSYNGAKCSANSTGSGTGAMAYVEFDSVYAANPVSKYVIFQFEVDAFSSNGNTFNYIDFGDTFGGSLAQKVEGHIYGANNAMSIRMPDNPLLTGNVGKKVTLIINRGLVNNGDVNFIKAYYSDIGSKDVFTDNSTYLSLNGGTEIALNFGANQGLKFLAANNNSYNAVTYPKNSVWFYNTISKSKYFGFGFAQAYAMLDNVKAFDESGKDLKIKLSDPVGAYTIVGDMAELTLNGAENKIDNVYYDVDFAYSGTGFWGTAKSTSHDTTTIGYSVKSATRTDVSGQTVGIGRGIEDKKVYGYGYTWNGAKYAYAYAGRTHKIVYSKAFAASSAAEDANGRAHFIEYINGTENNRQLTVYASRYSGKTVLDADNAGAGYTYIDWLSGTFTASFTNVQIYDGDGWDLGVYLDPTSLTSSNITKYGVVGKTITVKPENAATFIEWNVTDANGKPYELEIAKNDDGTYSFTMPAKKITVASVNHEFSLVEEVSATCETAGTATHYTCSHCDKLFTKDGDVYTEVTAESLVISALGHDYQAVAEVPATCVTTGVSAHYKCSRCDKLFTYDGENYTEVTADSLIIDLAAHTFGEWIAEVPATCTTNGTKGHYHCSVCGKDFDAEHDEIDDLTIVAAHTYGEWIAEVPATCTTNGTKGHYHCSVCGKDFDVGYTELDNLTIAAAHTYSEWIAEVRAEIGVAGTKGHYHCSVCNKNFDENYAELDSIVITAIDGIKYVSLSLNGDIGVNFYVYVGNAETLTANGEKLRPVESTVEGVKYFKFTINVAAKDYKNGIAISIDGTDISAKDYTVESYINAIDETNEAYALVQALKSYCESARLYFAKEEVIETEDLKAGALDSYKGSVEGTDENVQLIGATLILETKTIVNVYFKTDNFDSVVVKVNDEVVSAKKVDDYDNVYVVSVENVAKHLSTANKIEIGGYTINYSAMSYCYTVYNDVTASTALKNVIKTLYAYSVAANEYFA